MCDEILLRQRRAAAATTQTDLEMEVETVQGEQDGSENDSIVALQPLDHGMSGDRNADGGKGIEQEIEKLPLQLEAHLKELCSYVTFFFIAVSTSLILQFKVP